MKCTPQKTKKQKKKKISEKIILPFKPQGNQLTMLLLLHVLTYPGCFLSVQTCWKTAVDIFFTFIIQEHFQATEYASHVCMNIKSSIGR